VENLVKRNPEKDVSHLYSSARKVSSGHYNPFCGTKIKDIWVIDNLNKRKGRI
jgi:hypothetical protein